jgi:diaminopimelate decarboxylase
MNITKRLRHNLKSDNGRRIYEKPSITSHYLEATTKYTACAFNPSICRQIDGVDVMSLVHQFGSPLYVTSEKTLRQSYKTFIKELRKYYPDTYIAYSYKTNYLKGICSILHQEGAWAEVVSGLEYNMALGLGVDPAKIVFNGTYKSNKESMHAMKEGSLINIDSFNEIYQMENLASSLKATPIPVGIRVNVNINYPPWHKFGFNIESGQALEAVRRIQSSKPLRLNGLHCHIGTYVPDASSYQTAMQKIVEFALKIERELEVKIDYLDMGGGYASINTLHSQFLAATAVVPTPSQYAYALTAPLCARVSEFKSKPRLLLEPGRILVDECLSLVTTVVANKRYADGRKAIVIDAGVNLLPTAYWYKHEIASVQDIGANLEIIDIYGPLCMQIDIIRQNVRLPFFQKGHILVIKNVGAYNITQSMQFIYARPPVVIINNNQAEYLRYPEQLEDIQRLEALPDRLKIKS